MRRHPGVEFGYISWPGLAVAPIAAAMFVIALVLPAAGQTWLGWWYPVLFLAAALPIGWCVGFRVEVVGEELHWQSTLRRRRVPLTVIDRNGTFYPGSVDRLRLTGQRGLLVFSGDAGWLEFIAALDERVGSGRLRPTWWNRHQAKWSLWNGFYRAAAAPHRAVWPPPPAR